MKTSLFRGYPWELLKRRFDPLTLPMIYSYKIGDSFVSLPLSEAQAMLSTSTEQIDEEVSRLEESMQELRDEMKALKAQLYARFGKSINLD
jgi:chaperonin cofactor prefoldin